MPTATHLVRLTWAMGKKKKPLWPTFPHPPVFAPPYGFTVLMIRNAFLFLDIQAVATSCEDSVVPREELRRECQDWKEAFPHLRPAAVQLLSEQDTGIQVSNAIVLLLSMASACHTCSPPWVLS